MKHTPVVASMAWSLISSLACFAFEVRSERRIARQKFRDSVIEILCGFYPPPGRWSSGFEVQLAQAMGQVEVEVAKFRFHVRHRDDFDRDWAALKSHAGSLSTTRDTAYQCYGSHCEEDPRSAFYSLVEQSHAW